jgi:predicted dienelactone hydrolase
MNLTFTNLIELLLIAAIIIAIGIPLFGKMPNTRPFSEIDPVEEEFKHLLVRKEEILLSLKELEVDLQADKVSIEDYDSLRSKLEGEAINILERIDELKKNKKKGVKSPSKNFLLA